MIYYYINKTNILIELKHDRNNCLVLWVVVEKASLHPAAIAYTNANADTNNKTNANTYTNTTVNATPNANYCAN